jgi:pyruvate formate lyase activating enzyme
MKIAEFKESSLTEWEGHVSSIIWTPGCNWRCAYCNTAHLIENKDNLEVDPQTVSDYIKSKSGWIDGLVVTGGEPTLQADLSEFLTEIKKLGVAVKLETNGSRPAIIRKLITYKLIDCLNLDFKLMPDTKLLHLTSQNSGLFDVLDGLSTAFRSTDKMEVNFCTTLCPVYINIDTIREMGLFLHNKGAWVLRKYDPTSVLRPEFANGYVFSDEEVEEIVTEAKKHHEKVILL